MKRSSPLISQLYVQALKAGGVINAMETDSRRLLKAVEEKKTTEADLERMRVAQAKRDRRAARNARNAS